MGVEWGVTENPEEPQDRTAGPALQWVCAVVVCCPAMDGKNKLYFGDNLNILRDYVEDASVDLICLDPPFNSRVANPSADGLFTGETGEKFAAQIDAEAYSLPSRVSGSTLPSASSVASSSSDVSSSVKSRIFS